MKIAGLDVSGKEPHQPAPPATEIKQNRVT